MVDWLWWIGGGGVIKVSPGSGLSQGKPRWGCHALLQGKVYFLGCGIMSCSVAEVWVPGSQIPVATDQSLATDSELGRG